MYDESTESDDLQYKSRKLKRRFAHTLRAGGGGGQLYRCGSVQFVVQLVSYTVARLVVQLYN